MSNKGKNINKASLLARWRNRNKSLNDKDSIKAKPGISPIPEGLPIPLSYGQQRLWFLQQLFPENPFYHYADVYLLKGILHVEHLIQSFKYLIGRHEILRTTFHFENDQGVQKVQQEVKLDWSSLDLRHLPEEERMYNAEQLAIRAAKQPFDLEKGPLIRLSLIRIAEKDHMMVLSMHHIITDKWSMRIFRDELAEAYQAFIGGRIPDLPLLPIQYKDYSYWERSKETNYKNLNYWKKKLSGALPFLKLPTDHARPVRPSFKGAYHMWFFSKELSNHLKTLAKEQNTTLFVVLLTAYKVLLYRYSGQQDILVGTPFTNRDQLALENLIGFFNDTLVLRTDLSEEPTFLELLEKVRTSVMEAFAHKNTPFETLVKTLRPERSINANPFFQVMFLFHTAPPTPSFGTDLTLIHKPFDFGVSKFDLTLYIAEEKDHLSATIEYASDLFEPATIQRIHNHLNVLLKGITSHPELNITNLPIIPEQELHQQLYSWNDTKVLNPEISCIHHFFEKHANQNPLKTAVVFQNEKLDYATLNQKADNLAKFLQEKGVSPDIPVGLCVDRSVEMIVGILGILKAGGAYMPLDPEYPAGRISFMLENAEAKIVLCDTAYTAFFDDPGLEVITFDEIPEINGKEVFRPVNPDSSHLAYIIYTSGSSGNPKAVPVTHRNIVHSTSARFDYYPKQPESFLLLSSFAFDSSMVGIFWTLCSGGALIIPEKKVEQDIYQLANLFEVHKISHTLMLPSLYSLLLTHAGIKTLGSLNTVIVAGEACSAGLIALHFERLPEASLYNEYGPTEATVWCIVHQLKPNDAKDPVPIGRPISNTQVYILNQNLEAIPIGVVGEIYIGGEGVTNGYLNKPDLSEARFVDNPFKNCPPGKLYATGDLGRYRSDGVIEFLGRADHQIKIRGYRIELNEIQEKLKQHQQVEDAIVMVQKEKINDEVNEIDFLVKTLESLNPSEANQMLESIEKLSEKELDYLLENSQ